LHAGAAEGRRGTHQHKILDALDLALGNDMVEGGQRVRVGLLFTARPGHAAVASGFLNLV
jgi:hypothetical protein